MALDFSNPQQVERFRSAQIQELNNAPISLSQKKAYLSQLDDFLAKKQKEELGRQGVLSLEELSKDDPGTAVKLLYEGVKPKSKDDTVSASDAKLRGATKSGLQSLNRVQPKIEQGGPVRLLQLFGARSGNIPFTPIDLTPFGRTMEADLENIADVILRFRTGAQANKSEIDKFVRAFAPAVTDSAAVRSQKLDTLRAELEEVANSIGLNDSNTTSTSNLDDIDEELINKYKNQ